MRPFTQRNKNTLRIPQNHRATIHHIAPRFQLTGRPLLSGKCALLFGRVGNRPIVIKRLQIRETYWTERFLDEIHWYQFFERHSPPVRVPTLIDADIRQSILVITRAKGRPMATERYPTRPLPESDLTALLDTLGALHSWRRPPPPVSARAIADSYEARFRKYSDSGALPSLSPTEMARIIEGIQKTNWMFEFNHGDLLLCNALIDRQHLTLIDWEFAGYYLPGYDLALLWILLANDNEARRRIEQQVTNSSESHRMGFDINRLLLLGREFRNHRALESSDLQTQRLEQLRQDLEAARRELA